MNKSDAWKKWWHTNGDMCESGEEATFSTWADGYDAGAAEVTEKLNDLHEINSDLEKDIEKYTARIAELEDKLEDLRYEAMGEDL